jgi:hypothetical protein
LSEFRRASEDEDEDDDEDELNDEEEFCAAIWTCGERMTED